MDGAAQRLDRSSERLLEGREALCPQALVVADVKAFEADLAQRLLAREPTGVFPQTVGFAYELATRSV